MLPWLAAFAQTPRDYAVDLKVIPSPTVPRITLTWTQRQQAAITGQQVYRRLKGEVTWNLLATLSTTDTSYADATALAELDAANQAGSLPDIPAPGWQTLTIKDVVPFGTDPSGFIRLRVDRP